MSRPSKNAVLQHLSVTQLRGLATIFRVPGSHHSKDDLLERFTKNQRLSTDEILAKLTIDELCELAVSLGVELSTNSKDEAISAICRG